MIGTGWFSGTVDFGGVVLSSAGRADCVVLSLRPDGSTRWAKRFGGPGYDGCNEVSLSTEGRITTSIDTQGGWTPTGQGPLTQAVFPDTVLMRLEPDGSPQWMQPVGGDGWQRGKSLGVAPDGSVAFGGDTIGAVIAGGTTTTPPSTGGGRDAWMSRWGPDGTLRWVTTWGGPGNDLAKGVVDDGRTVTVVGPFTGEITVGPTPLDAGAANDLLVAQWSDDGQVRWATAVSALDAITGAELIAGPDGGVIFGTHAEAGMRFGSATGGSVALDADVGGRAVLAIYGPDGDPQLARTIPGTTVGNPGELARTGQRVHLDVVIRGDENTIDGSPISAVGKDAAVWAVDLR